MDRIIDGELYVGKPSKNRYHVSLRRLKSGHREHSIRRATDWEHRGKLDPDSLEAQYRSGALERPAGWEDELRQKSLRRAARRAKSSVRLRCKELRLDQLLTLTYAVNMVDKARAQHHFRMFLQAMRRALGEFPYCAVFETQKRGAWHVHLAVQRLPETLPASNGVKVKSVRVIAAVWRRVTRGEGGFVKASKLHRRVNASCARCAAYISKYCLKDYAEGEANSKRYWASRCEIPKPQRFDLVAETLADLIELVMVDALVDGGSIACFYLCPYGDSFFVACEPPGQVRRPSVQ